MNPFNVAVSACLALLLVGCAAGPSSTVAEPAGDIRDDGPRHYDGVPEVPQRITDRLRQYVNTRSASVRGWTPNGSSLFITTRFGETTQLHRVDKPRGCPGTRGHGEPTYQFTTTWRLRCRAARPLFGQGDGVAFPAAGDARMSPISPAVTGLVRL